MHKLLLEASESREAPVMACALTVPYRITNYGKQPAVIVEAFAALKVGMAAPSISPFDTNDAPAPSVIGAGGTLDLSASEGLDTGRNSGYRRENPKSSFWFYGSITYRGLIGGTKKPYTTEFLYRCNALIDLRMDDAKRNQAT